MDWSGEIIKHFWYCEMASKQNALQPEALKVLKVGNVTLL